MERKGMLHVENTLKTNIFNWEYCNCCDDDYGISRSIANLCPFCNENQDLNDYYCDLFEGTPLYKHGTWIKRCKECLEAATPYIEVENEEDV
jgi:hypothetical protein